MLITTLKQFNQHISYHQHQGYQARYGDWSLSSVFQPIFSNQLEVVGYEALVRIRHRLGHAVRPDLFFADTSLAYKDKINVERLSRAIHIRNFALSQYKHLKLFLNVLPDSGEYLTLGDATQSLIARRVKALKMKPEQLVMEIVEADSNSEQRLKFAMESLAEVGFNIAIDDFGVNASNAERVRAIQPSIIKIDRSLLIKLEQGDDSKVLEAIALAREIGASTVIEGVETETQLKLAQQYAIDMFQGYLLGIPENIYLLESSTA